jgi:hypothetical protein
VSALPVPIGLLVPVVLDDARRAERVTALLNDARYVLAAPERWARHASARRADGSACMSSDPAARAWSVVGALEKALLDRHYVVDATREWLPAWGLVVEAAHAIHYGVRGRHLPPKGEAHEAIAFVEVWGDARSHEAMLAGLDAAIAVRVKAAATAAELAAL